MASEIQEQMREIRLDRMRQGKGHWESVDIPSLPEMRVGVIPLTELEYDECLEAAGMIGAPENPAGWLRRDRRTNAETLVRAIRNPKNLEERVFEDIDELREILEVTDINYLTDRYFELAASTNPTLDGFTPEELEDAKKVLQTIDWSELSGSSWFALKRFLLSLGMPQLRGKLPGYSSTSLLTPQSSEDESTIIASENSTPTDAKSATNLSEQ